MNPDTEFQLTLPSNSSVEYYPNNKAADFTTRLPTSISLEGEWEAALIDIPYPHNWYNIPEDVGIVLIVEPADESILTSLETFSGNSFRRNGKYIPGEFIEEIKKNELYIAKWLISSVSEYQRAIMKMHPKLSQSLTKN